MISQNVLQNFSLLLPFEDTTKLCLRAQKPNIHRLIPWSQELGEMNLLFIITEYYVF